ncbi:MAG: hypothetical protein LBH57_00875, partial [Treponema sp.]|nr:hypothetical protein [Treponema sp.]
AIKAYYDGYAFIPESPVVAEVNQGAIITLISGKDADVSKKDRLLSLAGSISHEDFLEMEKTLLDTERVNHDEW